MPVDIAAREGLFPRPLILAGIVAILASVLLADIMPRFAPGLLRFEHSLADTRTSALSDQLPSQHPDVAIVGITDQTLGEYKTRLPIDRALLARLVDAIDTAGAKAIGIDILFFRTAPADNEEMLIDAIRRARAKVVMAGGDERLGLSQQELARQSAFLAQTGRPAGYVNLATERDWVVRFKAQPAAATAYPKSFAQLLAEAAGYPAGTTLRRIAWLREPRDGSDTFLTIPAETLLGPADEPLAKAARNGLKDKIVILGGLFPDMDQHLTPMTSRTNERMPGAVVHGHIVAETIDGRGVRQIEVELAGAAAGPGHPRRLWLPDRLALSPEAAGHPTGQPSYGRHHRHRHNCVHAIPYRIAERAGAAGVVHRRVHGPPRGQVARPTPRQPIYVVHKMKCRLASLLGLAASLVAFAGLSPARTDLHVIESTAPTIKVGSQLADRNSLTIPAGAQIRVVLPSGKTQTIKGRSQARSPSWPRVSRATRACSPGSAIFSRPAARRRSRLVPPGASAAWRRGPWASRGPPCR